MNNKKNLLLDISIELISKNSYSLKYADYKVEEKKEYKYYYILSSKL